MRKVPQMLAKLSKPRNNPHEHGADNDRNTDDYRRALQLFLGIEEHHCQESQADDGVD